MAPDTELDPYDVTMSDADSIPADRLAAQLEALSADLDAGHLKITAYLPRLYLDRLSQAAEQLPTPPSVENAYAGCRGIGHQRHVIATLARIASTSPLP